MIQRFSVSGYECEIENDNYEGDYVLFEDYEGEIKKPESKLAEEFDTLEWCTEHHVSRFNFRNEEWVEYYIDGVYNRARVIDGLDYRETIKRVRNEND